MSSLYLQGQLYVCLKSFMTFFIYMCGQIFHGLCMEVSWFSLFLPMSHEDGKDGCQIQWEVPLPTQPSYCSKYAFLNPILQITNPQIISVKVSIIIWHIFFINGIASTMLVLTYLLVCIKRNFKTPLVTRKQSTSIMRHT